MTRFAILAILLVGCKSSGTAVETDTDGPSCVANITSLSPVDGSVEVSVTPVIELQLSAPPGEDWALEILGVDGSATLAPNGLSAIFVPDTQLDWNTAYTASATVCGESQEVGFTTATEPVVIEAGDLFELPFDDLVWNQPSSAAVLTTFIEFDSFLMEILAVAPNGQGFNAAFTAAWPGGEPECPSVVQLVADYSDNPSFTTDAARMEVPVEGVTVPFTLIIDDLSFEGRFTAEGRLVDLRFIGSLDTRALDPLLGGPGATCDLAVLAGDVCDPCTDGEPFCLQLDVEIAQSVTSIGPGISGFCVL